LYKIHKIARKGEETLPGQGVNRLTHPAALPIIHCIRGRLSTINRRQL
jgi:hypothetical protein